MGNEDEQRQRARLPKSCCRFDALRIVVLRGEGRHEEALASEKEGGKGADLTPPRLVLALKVPAKRAVWLPLGGEYRAELGLKGGIRIR